MWEAEVHRIAGEIALQVASTPDTEKAESHISSVHLLSHVHNKQNPGNSAPP